MRFQSYHDPLDEPVAEALDPLFFDFDYGKPLGKEELKGAFVCCVCTSLLVADSFTHCDDDDDGDDDDVLVGECRTDLRGGYA